jgi:alpha-glucosidase
MQWDDSTSSGFSSNSTTWLPVALDFKNNNVKNQLAAATSHLKVFKELRIIRETDTLKNGTLNTFTFNNVLVILRELEGHESYVTVINLGSEEETVNFSTSTLLSDTLEYIVVDTLGFHKKG